jgi:hypothetical protein
MNRVIAMIFALRALLAPSAPRLRSGIWRRHSRRSQKSPRPTSRPCWHQPWSELISVTCTNGARPIVATAGSVSDGCHRANAHSAVSREP